MYYNVKFHGFSWFRTCNLNYMSNMFNDAMQRQRCLIDSRCTIWTCRYLTTGFYTIPSIPHDFLPLKNGLHRWSQRYSFGLHRSGTFWVASWSTSYDLRWFSVVKPVIGKWTIIQHKSTGPKMTCWITWVLWKSYLQWTKLSSEI